MSRNANRMAATLTAIDNLNFDIRRVHNDLKYLIDNIKNETDKQERKKLFSRFEDKVELIEITLGLHHVSLKERTDEFIWSYLGVLLEKLEFYYLNKYRTQLNLYSEYESSLEEVKEINTFEK